MACTSPCPCPIAERDWERHKTEDWAQCCIRLAGIVRDLRAQLSLLDQVLYSSPATARKEE